MSHRNLKTLENMVNNEMNNIAKWMDKNKLYVNSDKTQYMLFPPNITTKDYPQISVSISNNNPRTKTTLSHVTCSRYLEVILDYKLTWKKHLRKVTVYLLTSCNTEERIAQNIYIHNSNRNYKKLTTTIILIKKRIGIGYKNYGNQCPGLEYRLIPKLISWAGLKPKKIKKFL